MAFTVYILGEAPIKVNDRMDAMYYLGAKYGAAVYNKAVQEGLIVYHQEYLIVSPFIVEKVNPQINGLTEDFKLVKI